MTLVQCGDHQYAPGVVVCVHLLDGTSHEWCRCGVESGEESDWVCPECYERLPESNPDDLKVICMHCARKRRKHSEAILAKLKAGFMFTEEGGVACGEHGGQDCMMLAPNRELAEQYVTWVQKTDGTELSIVNSADILDPSPEKQLVGPAIQSAEYICLIESIDDDGIEGWIMLRPKKNKGDVNQDETDFRSVKEIASLMNDFIKQQVAATAATQAEIVAAAVRIPSDGLPEEALRPIAEELVKTAIQEHVDAGGTFEQPAAGGGDAGDHDQGEADTRLKWGELELPHYGESKGHAPYLEDSSIISEALGTLASQMDHAAPILRAIMSAVEGCNMENGIIEGHDVNIEVAADHILVCGPADLIDDLIGKGLLQEVKWEDESTAESDDGDDER